MEKWPEHHAATNTYQPFVENNMRKEKFFFDIKFVNFGLLLSLMLWP